MKHTGIWLLVIIMYQVEKCYCSGASRLWIHQVRELVPVRLGHTLGLLVLKTSGRNSQETVFKLGYILAFFFDLGNCCSAVFYHHWCKHLGCGDLLSFLTGLKELLLSFA